MNISDLNRPLSKIWHVSSAGINYWVGELNNRNVEGQIVARLVSVIKDYGPGGPDYNPADAATTIAADNQFTNRSEISDYMAAAVLEPPYDWETSTVFDTGGLNVTDDAATVVAAKGLINAMAGSGTNSRPIASPISLNVDSSVPYIELQLIGQDPDGDTITYELISSANGDGYSLAYVDSATGMMYITNTPNGNDFFTLYYSMFPTATFQCFCNRYIR